MPWTPWRNTSSAILKVSSNGVLGSIVCNKRSFGIVISASTASVISLIALSALRFLWAPSKVNGRVTTPTVKIPWSFASLATIGPAPEPVPPPAPRVIKTISAPFKDSLIFSRLSSAAVWPFSGSPPAPNPLPICTFVSAFEWCNACASVLIAINSTPERPTSFIWFTADPPSPPTPTTLMLAFVSTSVGFISGIFFPHYLTNN